MEPREYTREQVHFAAQLADLAANILRVMAGGGEAWKVAEALTQAHGAMQHLRATDTSNRVDPEHLVINNILRAEHVFGREQFERDIDQMKKMALRAEAAALLGQRTQEALAMNTFFDAFMRAEDFRAGNRT